MSRILFNDVVTEAKFSRTGSLQLQYDLYAMIDVFSPYSRRPHTHFKELQEASILLNMDSEMATYILGAIRDQDLTGYLHQCGINVLQSDQITCILSERLNL